MTSFRNEALLLFALVVALDFDHPMGCWGLALLAEPFSPERIAFLVEEAAGKLKPGTPRVERAVVELTAQVAAAHLANKRPEGEALRKARNAVQEEFGTEFEKIARAHPEVEEVKALLFHVLVGNAPGVQRLQTPWAVDRYAAEILARRILEP